MDYEVYDEHGVRIGPISDLFVDERDEPEHVGNAGHLPGRQAPVSPLVV